MLKRHKNVTKWRSCDGRIKKYIIVQKNRVTYKKKF